MKIDILTLFPNMFEGFLTESIIKRAIKSNKVNIEINNIRDFSKDSHKKVDDIPYGGGSGMVLMCQPIFDAVKSIAKDNSKVVLLTPQGIPFNQKMAENLSKEEHLIFICGHYEGFDERILSICDMEISIGDYVLTGGELPSMVVTDAVVRLVDDVIEKESHEKESFVDGLLDYPTYTKPRVFKDLEVPEVLLSGNHKNIESWREEERIKKTEEKRPDLLDKGKFKLYKNNEDIKLLNLEDLKGYSFHPKNNAKRTDIIPVTNMELMFQKFKKNVAKTNIDKKILTLIKSSILFFEEDSSEDNAIIVLGEAERLKALIKNYEKILDKEYRKEIEEKINMLIQEIKIEMISSKNKEEEIEEKQSRSR